MTKQAAENQAEQVLINKTELEELLAARENLKEARRVFTDQLNKAERILAEERLRMQALRGNALAVSCFSVKRDRNIEINNDAKISYSEAAENDPIFREALDLDPRIAGQRPQTRKVLLSAARQIPDAGQRREFILNYNHYGMLDSYDAGKREIILEYRRQTGRGLLWVRTRANLLPDPETEDLLAFYYTSDINDEKIRQEVMTKLLNINFETASFLDLQTRQVYGLEIRAGAKQPIPYLGDFDAMNRKYIPIYVYPEDQELCRRVFNLEYLLGQLERNPIYTINYRLQEEHPVKSFRRVAMQVFYLNGERRYLVFGRMDVTEQYEQEAARKKVLEEAAARAERANAAKSDFLARMSHDIRTPLNGILGMTELTLEEPVSPVVESYLRKIRESGEFLLSLVNDILDMSKVESGKLELHPEHYSYRELEKYLKAVIDPLCEAKQIEFNVINSFTRYTVLVDKLRLNQVLFNLLSNAVKFSPRGGKVELEFANHQVKEGRLELDILIRDHGIGMSEAFQKRLFQPFEQENMDRSAGRQGSGLGLAIVKKLVELMGGTIKLRSTKGRGTQVQLHLPFLIAPEVELKEAAQPVPADLDLNGRRILVVEDNAINAEIVLRLLQKKGAAVVVAVDGANAVKQYAEEEQYFFDLVLMDVQMPVLDGLEATRRIRGLRRPDAKTVPIIAMTANAFAEDVQACRAAGMNAHVAKPINIRKFFATLAEQLGGEN